MSIVKERRSVEAALSLVTRIEGLEAQVAFLTTTMKVLRPEFTSSEKFDKAQDKLTPRPVVPPKKAGK